MPRRCGLALACFLFASSLFADDQSLWNEYGLVHTNVASKGKLTITTYEMKDLTGALAAWEWLRSPQAKSCEFGPLCSEDGTRIVISDYNYVIAFEGRKPTKAQVDATLKALPNKHETSLPAILTFLPREGLVPNSARYVLGPVSLNAFAPELASTRPGFEQGAEAQVAQYRVDKSQAPVRLALFYYPTPEMARLHSVQFKLLPGAHAKRSDVLVAIVYGPATDAQADSLLSRVQYEAKITWNDVPPPSPIKPLYQLLLNIMYLSIILSAICLLAGLIYAGMRIYRRRYGTLEADEAMTTLHLSG
ncbi:MAG TPA: DUF6599 family protein [Bryobacteraceae bacterium]|jgi:hypothetical protein